MIVVFFRIIPIFFLLFIEIGKISVGVLHMAVGLVEFVLIKVVLLILDQFTPISFIEVELASFPNGIIFSLLISFSFLFPCCPSGCLCEFASITHRVLFDSRIILFLAIHDNLMRIIDKGFFFEGWIEGDDQRIGV